MIIFGKTKKGIQNTFNQRSPYKKKIIRILKDYHTMNLRWSKQPSEVEAKSDFFNTQAPSYSSLPNSTHLFMFWMFRKLWHRSIKKKYKYTSEKPDRVLVRLKSTAPHPRPRILCLCNALVRGGEWRDGSTWRVVIAGRAGQSKLSEDLFGKLSIIYGVQNKGEI